MASDAANGTTLTFGGTTQEVRSISFTNGGAEIQKTILSDTQHTYLAGMPDPSITCEVNGGTDLTAGLTGALSIAWNDGTTDELGTAIVTSVETSGEIDGLITTSLTFRNTS